MEKVPAFSGAREGPGRILTHTATWAGPCLPAAHFRQHEEGRAVQVPGLCQMPPPPQPLACLLPGQEPGAVLYLQGRLLYRLHITWAKNSKALFSSENGPTGTLAAPWLLLPKQ